MFFSNIRTINYDNLFLLEKLGEGKAQKGGYWKI